MKSVLAPLECYTKIQEAQPSYCSTLVNKEIGLNVSVQHDQVYKIKDCVDSSQSNAELYKRFSKSFINNMNNSIDQFFLFCGNDTLSRLESSIGLKRNPGLFMIAAIGILDDKYQHEYINYEVEVSFMEYIEGNFYDLLARTSKPLQMIREENNISFGESYAKVSTFDQFLKIFKIALFYNKQRDFKSEKNFSNQETKSTFVMTIATKIYEEKSVKIQKNTFVDFGMSESSSLKSIWEYFMIQLNNLTTKKKMYYHLIQPNPLLCLIRQNLHKSKAYLIYSLSANPTKFKENYQQLEELRELIELAVPIQIQRKKPKQDREKILQTISDELSNLMTHLREKSYRSLREFRELRDQCKKVVDEIKSWILKTQRSMVNQFQNKCQIKFAQNLIIADEIRLIGFCVKSDHYKDFYCAKSYISLEREVRIKTEEIRNELQALYKSRQNLYHKFTAIKYKETGRNPQILSAIASLKEIGDKIFLFFKQISMKVMFEGERAVVNEVLEEFFLKNSSQFLCKALRDFVYGLYEYKKERKIVSNEEIMKDNHILRLIRSMKKENKHIQTGKKEASQKKQKQKQRQRQLSNLRLHSENTLEKKKFIKLPLLENRPMNINGSFKILDLLLTPDQNL